MSLVEVSLFKAKPQIEATLAAGLVPMMVSSPGIGKSSLARKIADESNLVYIDLRIAALDPVYLEGLMVPTEGKIRHVPMEIFPLEDTPIPEGYKGWLINFDELTSAPKAVQAACYKVLLDRQIGTCRLHPQVKMIAAGNKATDDAVVYPMSTALRSRVVTYNIISDAEAWLQLANAKGFHPTLVAWITVHNAMLNNFMTSKSSVDTFACERTQEMLSKQLYALDKQGIPYANAAPLIAGTVGVAAFNSFFTFTEFAYEAVNIQQLRENPHVAVPANISAQWITMSNLSLIKDIEDYDLVFDYIDKFSSEFKIVFARMLAVRDPVNASTHPRINEWTMMASKTLC